MAQLTRSSVIKHAVDTAGLNQAVDTIPTTLGSIVSPTLDLNPRFTTTWRSDAATTSGARTLITAPTDKDLYITYVWLSISKTAASDCTSIRMEASINGATNSLIRLEFNTLTAERDGCFLVFPYPVKIDRGSSVTYTASFGAGAFAKSAGLGYFILE